LTRRQGLASISMTLPVLAKDNGETLRDHTRNCLNLYACFKDIFPKLELKCGKPSFYDDIATALFFHDFGKAAAGFQEQLKPNGQKWHYRHEILSIPFVDAFNREENQFIKELVLTHHKTLDDLSRYVEQEDTLDVSFKDRLSEIEKNLPYLNTLITEFPTLCPTTCIAQYNQKPILSLNFTKDIWEDLIRKIYRDLRDPLNQNDRLLRILGKGFVNSCDYMASAGIKNVLKPLPDIRPVFPFQSLTSVQTIAAQTKGNAIIIAPTGSGKTEASLFWATNNLDPTGGNRIFYTLPYTASINAMYLRLKEKFSPYYAGDETCISLMHGKATYYLYKFYEEQEKFNWVKSISKRIYSPYKVMTPFQSIKHFFSLKGYEMGLLEMYRGLFIIDEIHAYDAKNTALILGITEYLTSVLDAKFLIMSATLPAFIRELFADCLGISHEIRMTENELSMYLRHSCTVLDGDIFDHLDLVKRNIREKKKVLVVCNTVKRAQLLYTKLKNETQNSALLHGKFILLDRERIERSIADKNLLVGTQAIEVSLNIDYDVCFSEPAPIDALIQRFGRVNRRKDQNGFPLKKICPVYVFTKGSENDRYIYDQQKVMQTLNHLNSIDLLHENLLQQITDNVYSDGFGAQETEFKETKELFSKLINDLQPYTSKKRSESEFYNLFNSIEAVPLRYAAEYDECIRSGRIFDAMSYIVPLSLGQYHKLKFENRVEQDKERIIIDARYDNEIGLILDKRDPTASII